MRGWILAVWLLLAAAPAWAADERKKGADLCLSAKEDLILAMGGAEGKARLFKSTRIVRYATLDRDMTPFHFYPEPNLIQLLSDLAEVRFEKVPGDYDKLSDWSKGNSAADPAKR